ncbi:hypothetical protein [Azospirillum sp. sgz302134]
MPHSLRPKGGRYCFGTALALLLVTGPAVANAQTVIAAPGKPVTITAPMGKHVRSVVADAAATVVMSQDRQTVALRAPAAGTVSQIQLLLDNGVEARLLVAGVTSAPTLCVQLGDHFGEVSVKQCEEIVVSGQTLVTTAATRIAVSDAYDLFAGNRIQEVIVLDDKSPALPAGSGATTRLDTIEDPWSENASGKGGGGTKQK